jgi:hypothetical protein
MKMVVRLAETMFRWAFRITEALAWMRREWDYGLAIICMLIAAGYLALLVFFTHHIFWDLHFYAAVVKVIGAGGSPYDNSAVASSTDFGFSNGFVYPPLVARAFYALRWFLLSTPGLILLLTFHTIACVAIPYLLAGSPPDWRSRRWLYVWGLYLVLFGLGGLRLLAVGNISAILYAALIFSIVAAVKTKSYRLFWVAILVCAYVKFYLLAYLLFPVILDRRYLAAAALICSIAALYALDYLISPPLFAQYIAQVLAHSSETGLSFFSLLVNVSTPAVAFGFQALFAALIFFSACGLAEHRGRPQNFDLFCCWLFLSAFLASPRIFDYDLAIATVPCVLLTRMLIIDRGTGIVVASVVTAAGSALMVRSPIAISLSLSQWTGTFMILGVWLGSVAHWIEPLLLRPGIPSRLTKRAES